MFISLHWSTSRGRDTYGYNIARLTDNNTGKHYRTCGGGYDMTGTVVAHWLSAVYQDRLSKIADRAGSWYGKDCPYQSHRTQDGRNPAPGYLYAMTRNVDTGAVSIDGACGLRSVEDIAREIGITLQWVGNRRGHTIGWNVLDAHGAMCPMCGEGANTCEDCRAGVQS